MRDENYFFYINTKLSFKKYMEVPEIEVEQEALHNWS